MHIVVNMYKIQINNGEPYYTTDFDNVLKQVKELKRDGIFGHTLSITKRRLSDPVNVHNVEGHKW